jgi:hypothetical protein
MNLSNSYVGFGGEENKVKISESSLVTPPRGVAPASMATSGHCAAPRRSCFTYCKGLLSLTKAK